MIAVQPCPSENLWALEVDVFDPEREPCADVIVYLKAQDGQVIHDKTGKDGRARYEGLEAGSFEVTLWGRDQDLWTQDAVTALPDALTKASLPAQWQAARSDTPQTQVKADWGECLYLMAHRLGVAPEAIWDDPANKDLIEAEHAEGREPSVLKPTDTLAVPAPVLRRIPVETKNRYDVILKAETFEYCTVLSVNDAVRSGLDCLVEVDGVGMQLTTDGDGMLIVPVEPDSSSVRITIDEIEVLDVTLGELLPVSTYGGVMHRLLNLGYLLYPLGVLDAEGRALLRDAHGSQAMGYTTDEDYTEADVRALKKRRDFRTLMLLREAYSSDAVGDAHARQSPLARMLTRAVLDLKRDTVDEIRVFIHARAWSSREFKIRRATLAAAFPDEFKGCTEKTFADLDDRESGEEPDGYDHPVDQSGYASDDSDDGEDPDLPDPPQTRNYGTLRAVKRDKAGVPGFLQALLTGQSRRLLHDPIPPVFA